ncbi:Holliday junction branch migration protein RuvA [Enterococcus sp. AD013-P3]|uniref:Holliday junction branch migration protein RuvA n=1 Tax=Enterococcus sp. AD013-P3 TaxID=3411036 RepID=UPI003B92DA06
MFEYIIGRLVEITPAYIVLENNGIGYQIAMGNPYRLSSKLEEEVKIYVQQVIRDDAHLLYGFRRPEEKLLFLRLISVSGIGPKSGLAIMANEDHTGMVHAIESGNVNYLVKFPGVGKKTAQQMILDLQGKLGEFAGEEMMVAGVMLPRGTEPADTPMAEALAALEALGYSAKEVKRVEKELQSQPKATTDEYLREALKLMMK